MEESETALASTERNPIRTPNYSAIADIYVEDLGQNPMGFLIFASPYGSQSVSLSVDHVFMVLSHPSGSSHPSSSFSIGLPTLCLIFDCGTLRLLRSVVDEVSLVSDNDSARLLSQDTAGRTN